MTKLLIIAGATATGKSSIALDIASKYKSEIISCDSMQIYRDMNIGTAKVTEKEQSIVTHHLIDVANIDEKFTVGDYQKRATSAINYITLQGKLPILTGGTGLYIDSIIYPFGLGDSVSDINVRMRLEDEYSRNGAQAMHDKLMNIDSLDAAKIHPNNKIRLIRAMEIFELTGKSKTELSEGNRRMSYDIVMLIPDIDREILYGRIDERVEQMFDNGLESEVRGVTARCDNAFALQSMQAIGYKEFANYFAGAITLEDVKNQIKQNSRNYAKRQITWLKNKYPFATWGNADEFDAIIKSRYSNFCK